MKSVLKELFVDDDELGLTDRKKLEDVVRRQQVDIELVQENQSPNLNKKPVKQKKEIARQLEPKVEVRLSFSRVISNFRSRLPRSRIR